MSEKVEEQRRRERERKKKKTFHLNNLEQVSLISPRIYFCPRSSREFVFLHENSLTSQPPTEKGDQVELVALRVAIAADRFSNISGSI